MEAMRTAPKNSWSEQVRNITNQLAVTFGPAGFHHAQAGWPAAVAERSAPLCDAILEQFSDAGFHA